MVGHSASSVELARQFDRNPGALPRLRGRGEQGRCVARDLPLAALSGSNLLGHSERGSVLQAHVGDRASSTWIHQRAQ
jgi:hypothetical protein